VVGKAGGVEVLVAVTVLEIERGKVRLGFEAAGDLPIHRLEVWNQMLATPKRMPSETGPSPILFGTVFAPR
jgi:sRNA-binding carbon storage regulator CsrA